MPNKSEELKKVFKNGIFNVNAHLHTPHSFSAFNSIAQAMELAAMQGVKIVGINDFYCQEGYAEWAHQAQAHSLFPLFNMELIGLHQPYQQQGIRVNDTNNPGRIYLSGKGMRYPSHIPEPYAGQLHQASMSNHLQVVQMCHKLNHHLSHCLEEIRLNIEALPAKHGVTHLRERHIARELRTLVFEKCQNVPEAIVKCLQIIFGGTAPMADVSNIGAVENEIRSRLLKIGGAAFVAENSQDFLSLDNACHIIISGGGIPTYPFLADNAKGGFTHFEQNLEEAAAALHQKDIHSVEFIPGRNSAAVLEAYATYLFNEGFIVTFGSEHNTPTMEPLLLSTREGKPLSDNLQHINYAGACVIAAHQHRVNQGKEGFTHSNQRDELIHEGDCLIQEMVA